MEELQAQERVQKMINKRGRVADYYHLWFKKLLARVEKAKKEKYVELNYQEEVKT